MKRLLFLLAVIVACLSWSEARADYSFSFMSDSGDYGVKGTLLTPSNGNDPLTITGGSLTGDGALNSGVIYTLLSAGTTIAYGGDHLISDNRLTPSLNIVLTGDGLAFRSSINNSWINIWGNQNNYTYFQSGPNRSWEVVVNGNASLSPVPLPASLFLLGPGLLGLVGLKRRYIG